MNSIVLALDKSQRQIINDLNEQSRIDDLPDERTFEEAVQDFSDLPLTGNSRGDIRHVNSIGHEFIWAIDSSSGTYSDWWDYITVPEWLDILGKLEQVGDTQLISNKVLIVSENSDDIHYPSAKAVWDAIQAHQELPSQTGHSGKFLTTDGTSTSWSVVDSLPAQSGQAGKYLTTNGSAASWSTVDSLPSQSGQQGKYLQTNGTVASWQEIQGSVPVITIEESQVVLVYPLTIQLTDAQYSILTNNNVVDFNATDLTGEPVLRLTKYDDNDTDVQFSLVCGSYVGTDEINCERLTITKSTKRGEVNYVTFDKVKFIDSGSTHHQIPSAKCVYDAIHTDHTPSITLTSSQIISSSPNIKVQLTDEQYNIINNNTNIMADVQFMDRTFILQKCIDNNSIILNCTSFDQDSDFSATAYAALVDSTTKRATFKKVDFIDTTIIEEEFNLKITNPTLPTADGTYTLQLVISGGNPTYSWISST